MSNFNTGPYSSVSNISFFWQWNTFHGQRVSYLHIPGPGLKKNEETGSGRAQAESQHFSFCRAWNNLFGPGWVGPYVWPIRPRRARALMSNNSTSSKITKIEWKLHQKNQQ